MGVHPYALVALFLEKLEESLEVEVFVFSRIFADSLGMFAWVFIVRIIAAGKCFVCSFIGSVRFLCVIRVCAVLSSLFFIVCCLACLYICSRHGRCGPPPFHAVM